MSSCDDILMDDPEITGDIDEELAAQFKNSLTLYESETEDHEIMSEAKNTLNNDLNLDLKICK